MASISKRAKKILLVILLICLSALFLVACGAKDDIHNIATTIPEPKHFMAKFMMAINKKVPNFGLTVIVFTISLRLILSPFDIWQQIVMKKNNAKMKKMKPELEALQKKFADDKQRYQQEQMALYKREKYSMVGSCLPTIITMIIFFVVFAGFRQTVSYEFAKSYQRADQTYERVFKDTLAEYFGKDKAEDYHKIEKNENNKEQFERARRAARRAVREYYGFSEGADQKYKFTWAHKKSDNPQAKNQFLWIQNIFVSDTWKTPVATYEEVTGQAGSASGRLTGLTKDRYEEVMHDVIGKGGHGRKKNAGKWNGLLILPLLTIALSLITSILFAPAEPPTAKPGKGKEDDDQKKKQNGLGSAGTMKAMKYIMPLVMGVFAIMYSGAFALYMLFSSLFSAVLIQAPFKIAATIEEKKEKNK